VSQKANCRGGRLLGLSRELYSEIDPPALMVREGGVLFEAAEELWRGGEGCGWSRGRGGCVFRAEVALNVSVVVTGCCILSAHVGLCTLAPHPPQLPPTHTHLPPPSHITPHVHPAGSATLLQG
jgi:hypothetical protein